MYSVPECLNPVNIIGVTSDEMKFTDIMENWYYIESTQFCHELYVADYAFCVP
jgi:hypothetical protein